MKKFIYSIISVLILLSCSESTDINYDDEYSLLQNSDIKESISLLNSWRNDNNKITSYVTPKILVAEFPDGRTITKNLPDDEMYVAIAPYLTRTHSCTNHYLSKCDAELKNKEFYVQAYINDKKIINGNYNSLDNGFIELWLPRNKTIKIEIKYSTKKAEETFITDDNCKTCFTTFYLE
jgi:hypothetical protein